MQFCVISIQEETVGIDNFIESKTACVLLRGVREQPEVVDPLLLFLYGECHVRILFHFLAYYFVMFRY